MEKDMKLLLINSVLAFGSTGRIVLDIAKEYEKDGYEVKIAYGQKRKVSKVIEEDIKKYGVCIGTNIDVYFHALYTRLTDKHGLASKRATEAFLNWAEAYNPDILWLHNIHDYYINYELLFTWIKSRPQMQVKWTLHDCWAFTGHCSHFTYVKCDKWKSGCHSCPQLDQYPRSISDNSKDNYNRKKTAFTGVSNMTLITPSNWLKEKVKESFLTEYPVEVKYNTIDKNVFKPTPSTFKEDHGIQDKKMILGVANIWNDRKGLKDFIELSKLLEARSNSVQNDNNADQAFRYQIVLVGLNDNQLKELREKDINILGLPRTSSAKELAQVYSAADVFVNPSYEETFGLTTAEAQACGTYTIVYKDTACEEIVDRSKGTVVDTGANAILKALDDI